MKKRSFFLDAQHEVLWLRPFSVRERCGRGGWQRHRRTAFRLIVPQWDGTSEGPSEQQLLLDAIEPKYDPQ